MTIIYKKKEKFKKNIQCSQKNNISATLWPSRSPDLTSCYFLPHKCNLMIRLKRREFGCIRVRFTEQFKKLKCLLSN